MKELIKNKIYYYKDKKDPDSIPRLWHNCFKYKREKPPKFWQKHKDGAATRIEIDFVGHDGDMLKYKCPHCGFKYELDKGLNV